MENIDEDVKISLAETERKHQPIEGTFHWYISEMHKQAMPLFVSALETYLGIFQENSEIFQNFSKEVLNNYIQSFKTKLKEVSCDLNSFTLCLHIINSDMHKLREIIPSQKNFRVEDKFTELYEFAMRHQVEIAMESLLSTFIELLQNLNQEIQESELELPEKIDSPADSAAYNLMYAVISAVMELQPLIESSRYYLTSEDTFASLIALHLVQFFKSVKQGLTVYSLRYPVPEGELSVVKELKVSGSSIIGFLKLAITLEDTGLPKLLHTIAETYSSLGIPRNEITQIVDKTAKPELLSVLKSAQEEILLIYIEFYGKAYSDYLKEYLNTDWKEEPIDVSEAITNIAVSLKDSRKELKTFFKGQKPSHQRVKRKRDKNTVELEMERLFARKIKPVENVKFELNSILGSIIKLTFKAFYEELRCKKVTNMQQIQVDANFLGSCFEEMVVLEDQGIISGYVQEVIYTAKCRCVAPSELSKHVLESIVESKKQQLNIKPKDLTS